ncbi:Atp-dependent dna helicase 2 subunit ku80 [Thalictrum thalictroides]|uniref:Atp-dependent dna helicase 2 subunit ku80 n=1 Tax=Thalictrum thalictroides TaxID=46969 RepID=A0A7J6VJH8_THATH|nr:Atp-dependent dna helicase 2 subunit ku80 [Thalictrum thalictroides]
MARKESLLLLLDVGPSMHSFLPEVERFCTMLVQKKMIYNKNDEVGVVLFGTDDTNNELTSEVGGYQHVVVLRDSKVVDGDAIEALQKLPRGNFPGDFVRGNSTENADKRILDENDCLLNRFSRGACTKTVYVESPTKLLGALQTRNVSPVTISRGDLELSPKMKIKVWVYKKTSEEMFPKLKKYSDKASPTDRSATHGVKVNVQYIGADSNKVVPPQQRIKGYRYGPQLVPISSAEVEAIKFKPDKSVKLLGFTNATNIMRHYYMKDVYIFIAEPANMKAILAVSALVRAMKEMNMVAILRCVWRQGQANVVVGVLTPNESNAENMPDSFFFNVLPFAEDVRDFRFPSFSKFPSSWQPNEQQQDAADKLVMMLDLAPPGKEEALQADFTPNPVLERFYHFLELKSKNPDAFAPPLDNTLLQITKPDPELLSQNKSVIDEFCKQFELKKNPKINQSSGDEPTRSSEEPEGSVALNTRTVNSVDNDSSAKVDSIGDLTPIQDFEAMMARRDSKKWVDKAIKDMKALIYELVENSYRGDTYEKAVNCLVALRKGCILEHESKQFNELLRRITKFCQEIDLITFCEFLLTKHITLITKTEAIDSDVGDEEALRYLIKTEPALD